MRTHIFGRSAFESLTTRSTSTISRIGTICTTQTETHDTRAAVQDGRDGQAGRQTDRQRQRDTDTDLLVAEESHSESTDALDGHLHVRLLVGLDVDVAPEALLRDHRFYLQGLRRGCSKRVGE